MASNEMARGGGEIARVQIYKYVTKDRVLDISDMLSLDPRRNKISFTLLEFDENYKAKTRVRHFVDVPDFKLVCWDILHGSFAEWTDHKGSANDEGMQARVLTLRKDVKYRQPFVLKIDNGVGEAIGNGAVKMVRATDSLTLLMPEFDARRMAQTVLDYVRDWETVNFRKRQEAQTVVITLPDGSGGGNAHDGGAPAGDGDDGGSGEGRDGGGGRTRFSRAA
jgi:hypothetical protein